MKKGTIIALITLVFTAVALVIGFVILFVLQFSPGARGILEPTYSTELRGIDSTSLILERWLNSYIDLNGEKSVAEILGYVALGTKKLTLLDGSEVDLVKTLDETFYNLLPNKDWSYRITLGSEILTSKVPRGQLTTAFSAVTIVPKPDGGTTTVRLELST